MKNKDEGVNEESLLTSVFKIPLGGLRGRWRTRQSNVWGSRCSEGLWKNSGCLWVDTTDGKRSNGVDFFFFEVIQRRGNKLINPAWPGQRWHPGPVWRAGATPGGWCCLLKTDGGKCLPFQARESEWQRFLRRGPRELWLLPGSSACGSRSDTKGV